MSAATANGMCEDDGDIAMTDLASDGDGDGDGDVDMETIEKERQWMVDFFQPHEVEVKNLLSSSFLCNDEVHKPDPLPGQLSNLPQEQPAPPQPPAVQNSSAKQNDLLPRPAQCVQSGSIIMSKHSQAQAPAQVQEALSERKKRQQWLPQMEVQPDFVYPPSA